MRPIGVLVGVTLLVVLVSAQAYEIKTVDNDFNDDNKVDWKDFYILYKVAKKKCYNESYDINWDKKLDRADLQLLYDIIQWTDNDFRCVGNETYYFTFDNQTFKMQGVENVDTLMNFLNNYLRIWRHPWIAPDFPNIMWDSDYVCMHFAIDMFTASYKKLGYGIVLIGVSDEYYHAFNVIWLGGNVSDLNNYAVFDPQNSVDLGLGYDIKIATEAPLMRQPDHLFFLYEKKGNCIYAVEVPVDFENATVLWNQAKLWGIPASQSLEEPVPDKFNTTYEGEKSFRQCI